jgi:hypothetical protein
MAADGGLGQIQLPACFREVAAFHYGNKNLQLFQADIHTSILFPRISLLGDMTLQKSTNHRRTVCAARYQASYAHNCTMV